MLDYSGDATSRSAKALFGAGHKITSVLKTVWWSLNSRRTHSASPERFRLVRLLCEWTCLGKLKWSRVMLDLYEISVIEMKASAQAKQQKGCFSGEFLDLRCYLSLYSMEAVILKCECN